MKHIEELFSRKASEDVSHLLRGVDIVGKNEGPKNEFDTNGAINWILDVRFPGSVRVEEGQLASFFYHSSICDETLDYDSAFLVSNDESGTVIGIRLGWMYMPRTHNQQPTSELQYHSRIVAVRERLKPVVGDVEIHPNLAPKAAAARVKYLLELNKRPMGVVFYVDADDGAMFEGNEIWDVMLCLGLKYCYSDTFCWGKGPGTENDSYFRVMMSNGPRHSTLKLIASGKLTLNYLAFLMSIPKTVEPLKIAERMEVAAKYVQSRLGGRIHYEVSGKVCERQDAMREIESIAEELVKEGFIPGGSTAARFFSQGLYIQKYSSRATWV